MSVQTWWGYVTAKYFYLRALLYSTLFSVQTPYNFVW